MKKRIVIVVLLFLSVLMFVGCSSGNNGSNGNNGGHTNNSGKVIYDDVVDSEYGPMLTSSTSNETLHVLFATSDGSKFTVDYDKTLLVYQVGVTNELFNKIDELFNNMESFVVPDKYDNIPVTRINSFPNAPSLKTLTIGANVSSIEKNSFNGLTGLKKLCFNSINYNELDDGFDGLFAYSPIEEVIIGDNVKYIPKKFLYNANYANYPNGVGYKNPVNSVKLGNSIETIGSYAFYGVKLESVVLPSTIRKINACALYTYSLASIFIPSTIEELGVSVVFNAYTIVYTDALSKKPNWDEHFAEVIYYGKNGPDYVSEDGFEYMLEDDEAKLIRAKYDKEVIEIPSSITVDGKEYPVTTVGSMAFSINIFTNCAPTMPTLRKVIIPSSIKTIEHGAFWFGSGNLANLDYTVEVFLPDTVEEIEFDAFCFGSNIIVYTPIESQEAFIEKYGRDVFGYEVVVNYGYTSIPENN